jgi:hypothetical protein
VLDRIPTLQSLRPRFALLVPVLDRPPRYRLYVQGLPQAVARPLLDRIGDELQRGLEENPYYRHAVGLGQLGAVEVAALDPAGESGWLVYQRHRLAEGQKCGDIKPVALDRRTVWPERLGALTVASANGRR